MEELGLSLSAEVEDRLSSWDLVLASKYFSNFPSSSLLSFLSAEVIMVCDPSLVLRPPVGMYGGGSFFFGVAFSDEAHFNQRLWDTPTGTVRRECDGCTATHQDSYIQVDVPLSWTACQELLITWAAGITRLCLLATV